MSSSLAFPPLHTPSTPHFRPPRRACTPPEQSPSPAPQPQFRHHSWLAVQVRNPDLALGPKSAHPVLDIVCPKEPHYSWQNRGTTMTPSGHWYFLQWLQPVGHFLIKEIYWGELPF